MTLPFQLPPPSQVDSRMATPTELVVYVGRRTVPVPPAQDASSESAPPPTRPRTRASVGSAQGAHSNKAPSPKNTRASISTKAPARGQPKDDPTTARVFSGDIHERRVRPIFVCRSIGDMLTDFVRWCAGTARRPRLLAFTARMNPNHDAQGASATTEPVQRKLPRREKQRRKKLGTREARTKRKLTS